MIEDRRGHGGEVGVDVVLGHRVAAAPHLRQWSCPTTSSRSSSTARGPNVSSRRSKASRSASRIFSVSLRSRYAKKTWPVAEAGERQHIAQSHGQRPLHEAIDLGNDARPAIAPERQIGGKSGGTLQGGKFVARQFNDIELTDCRVAELDGEAAQPVVTALRVLPYQSLANEADEIEVGLAGAACRRRPLCRAMARGPSAASMALMTWKPTSIDWMRRCDQSSSLCALFMIKTRSGLQRS